MPCSCVGICGVSVTTSTIRCGHNTLPTRSVGVSWAAVRLPPRHTPLSHERSRRPVLGHQRTPTPNVPRLNHCRNEPLVIPRPCACPPACRADKRRGDVGRSGCTRCHSGASHSRSCRGISRDAGEGGRSSYARDGPPAVPVRDPHPHYASGVVRTAVCRSGTRRTARSIPTMRNEE